MIHDRPTPAFLLPIAGGVWLALSSVATPASDSALPQAQRTVQPPGQQHDDELTQLRRNAERGDRHGQFSLGLIYEEGEGISRDDAQAAEWYQKAADQGHPQAQYHLGLMYVDGRGRARDNATGFAGFARRQTTDWQRRSMPWGWPLPQGAESRRMT